MVYDLSGNGKTAVRMGFNRFMTAQTTGFAQLYNPTALTTQTLPWTDVNRDDIAQGERGCQYLSTGCEINFSGLATNFGRRSLARFDPDIQRPYSLPLNIGMSHELFSGVSVSAEYYRIWFRDITMRVNTLLDENSYNRFDVVSPLDGSTVPAWVIKPEFRGQVDLLDSTSEDMKRDYNGIDINFNARMARGVRAFGGFNFERSINDTCASAVHNPNLSPIAINPERYPLAEAVQGHGALSHPVLGHLGERGVPEPERLSGGHGRPGLWRLHGRHGLRQPARAGDVLPGRPRRRRTLRPTFGRR